MAYHGPQTDLRGRPDESLVGAHLAARRAVRESLARISAAVGPRHVPDELAYAMAGIEPPREVLEESKRMRARHEAALRRERDRELRAERPLRLTTESPSASTWRSRTGPRRSRARRVSRRARSTTRAPGRQGEDPEPEPPAAGRRLILSYAGGRP
jgi:hypothetical protein